MKPKHSNSLEHIEPKTLPDVCVSERLREFLPAKFPIVNAGLVDAAFHPAGKTLTEPPRPRNPDTDDELDMLVAEMMHKDVIFGCGVTGSGADFATLLARQFHDSGKSVLIVSPSVGELDFIARRVKIQITPQKTREAGAFHLSAQAERPERVGQPTSSEIDTEVNEALIVIANLSEVATNPAIYQRAFDVVIVVDAEQATIARTVHAAYLAKQKLIVLGDPYRPSTRPSGTGVPHDIFEFSGITAALQNGDNDPRLIVLPTRGRGGYSRQVVSTVAYSGRLAFKEQLSETEHNCLRSWLRIIDTGAYLNPTPCNDTRAKACPTLASLLVAAVTSDLPFHSHYISLAIFTADGANQRLLRALSHHLPVDFRITTLTQPHSDRADHVVLDLHQSTDLGNSEASPSQDFRCLTAALTSADNAVTLIGDISTLERTLPADAPVRQYLDAFRTIGVPVEPFPIKLLGPASDLKAPGLRLYFDATEAWKQIHVDITASEQPEGGHFPSKPATGTTHLEQSVAANLASVGTSLPAQDYRVGTSRQGEIAVFIADDLFWLLGSLEPRTNGRPFVRVRARQAIQILAEIFN